MDIRLKVNLFKSFRLKIAYYALISTLATAFTDGIIILGLGIYNRQMLMEAKRMVEPMSPSLAYSNNIRMSGLTNNLWLDILILGVFSLLIFLIFFILASHNMVNYLREINRGIERITQGDLDTNVRIIGEDEISMMAYSINEMRMEIKEVMDKERMAEKSKNELITNVAHDLRTPLTSIIGYLDLIKNEDYINKDMRLKYIGIAYDKSKNLESLIEDLFDFTRYAKDKIQMKKDRIDINRFMEQLIEEFYPSFSDNHLEVQVRISQEELYIEVDGELLARAIGNLITNAIKYGSDGKLILVSTESMDDYIRIEITNFGKIIPRNDLNKIFDKFYRVESSRSANTGGTGLGLAIAKNIIDMHDGEISVRSDEDGTVFEIKLQRVNKEDEDKIERK